MKKLEMLNESLEQFIIKFLPEGKLILNKNLELKEISQVIDRIFIAHDDSVIAESIFARYIYCTRS